MSRVRPVLGGVCAAGLTPITLLPWSATPFTWWLPIAMFGGTWLAGMLLVVGDARVTASRGGIEVTA